MRNGYRADRASATGGTTGLISLWATIPLQARIPREAPRAEIEAAPIHRPWLALRSKDMLNKFFGHPAPHENEVKNPVRTNDLRWRTNDVRCREHGAFWLFHVAPGSGNELSGSELWGVVYC